MPSSRQKATRYQKYLQSAAWRRLKVQVLERDDWRCQRCGAKDCKLQVHHLSYERLYEEELEDLISWCEKCHRWHHDLERKKKLRKAGRSYNTVSGLCRVCGARMWRPYWPPGGGHYCSDPCREIGCAETKARKKAKYEAWLLRQAS